MNIKRTLYSDSFVNEFTNMGFEIISPRLQIQKLFSKDSLQMSCDNFSLRQNRSATQAGQSTKSTYTQILQQSWLTHLGSKVVATNQKQQHITQKNQTILCQIIQKNNQQRFKSTKELGQKEFTPKMCLMKRNTIVDFHSLVIVVLVFLLFSNFTHVQSATVQIKSSSIYTGIFSTYYFSIKSHSSPRQLVLQFSDWSFNEAEPFTSGFQISQNMTSNGVPCSKTVSKTIMCNLTSSLFSGSAYPAEMIFKMSGIYNPSSLKPYLVTVYLINTASTDTISSYLTVSEPRVQKFILDSYSYEISKQSSVDLYFEVHNYISAATFMNFTYETNLVTIDMIPNGEYSDVSSASSPGLKRMTNWNSISFGLKTLKMNFTNIAFAASYTISGVLYFISSGVQYKIQKYSLTVQLQAVKYADIGFLSSSNKIRVGTNVNSLALYSQCGVAAISNGTTNSYFKIQYDNTVLNIAAASTCLAFSTSGSISICTLSIPNNGPTVNNSVVLSNIKSLIPANAVLQKTSLKVQSLSYFSIMNAFFPICSSRIDVTLTPQTLSPISNLTICNQVVGQANTLTFQMSVQNPVSSDVLTLSGFQGKIVNKTGSLSFTYDSSLNRYSYSLSAAQLTATNSVSFTVSFSNPTFVSGMQPSMVIELSRRLTSNNSLKNIYGQTFPSFGVCPVTTVLQNSTNTILSLGDISTYKTGNTYSVQLGSSSIQFKDYAINDYILLYFKNRVQSGSSYVQTDSPFQLYSLQSGILPVVLLNFQHNLKTQVISSSVLKITFNSTAVVNTVNSQTIASLILVINALSNPFFVSEVFCLLKTYNSLDYQKQSILTTKKLLVSSVNTQLNALTNSVITLLQNNTINLKITSLSQKIIVGATFSYISSLYFVVIAPFTCSNLDSNNQITVNLPYLTTSQLNISLNDCSLGYFSDNTQFIVIKQYAKFSHSNLTTKIATTSSSYGMKSTCTDACHFCDTNTLKCNSCFNTTHTQLNLLYLNEGKCFQTCPTKSFKNMLTCEDCHSICVQCSNSTYDTCTKCASNYIMNSAGICQSVCGKSMFISSGVCSSCHPNCQGCLTQNKCYSCKPGAVLFNQAWCNFVQCQSPCQTCQSSVSFCLSCISATETYYFYQNSCSKSCPEGTFEWKDSESSTNKNICMKVTASNIYFVGIILSILALVVALGIRCFAPKKSKASLLIQNEKDSLSLTTNMKRKVLNTSEANIRQTRNMLNKTQNGISGIDPLFQQILLHYLDSSKNQKRKIYKLNISRFMTVFLSYIQLICALVILVSGGKYNPSGVNELIYVGLAGLVVTNLVFGIKHYKEVYKKLSAKREKFVQTNLMKPVTSIEIQPEAIKQQPSLQNNGSKQNDANQQIMVGNQINRQRNISREKINEAIFDRSQKSSQHKDEMTSTQRQKLKLSRSQLTEFDNQILKELLIVLLSSIFTLRTYNILRSNLFYIFNQESLGTKNKAQSQEPINSNSGSNLQEINNSNSALKLPHRQTNQVVELNKTEVIGSKKVSPVKKGTKQIPNNVIKIQPKPLVVLNKQNETLKNKKSMLPGINLSQTQNIVNSIRPFSIPEGQTNHLLQLKKQYVNRFLHPFYTYIMFASLIFVSLLFAIASVILIFNKRYTNMMIWGIDALIVIGINFLINVWDLWKAVNLSKQEQNSQISSQKDNINQTMENLKNNQEDYDKINLDIEGNNANDFGATKKLSTVKMSNQKSPNNKLSGSKKNNFTDNNSLKKKRPGNDQFFEGDEIQLNSFSKSKSPKSPSQRTEKTKAFGKNKSPNKSSGNMDFDLQQKPPQLKIFDDLELQDTKMDVNNFNKAEKVRKGPQSKNQTSMKIRSSNRTLYGRKTQMSQKISQTTRGNKQTNAKMDDIYLGFLDGDSKKVVYEHREPDQSQINESDQISTVKLEGRQLIQSIKQSSIINIHSEEQVDEIEWKNEQIQKESEQK